MTSNKQEPTFDGWTAPVTYFQADLFKDYLELIFSLVEALEKFQFKRFSDGYTFPVNSKLYLQVSGFGYIMLKHKERKSDYRTAPRVFEYKPLCDCFAGLWRTAPDYQESIRKFCEWVTLSNAGDEYPG